MTTSNDEDGREPPGDTGSPSHDDSVADLNSVIATLDVRLEQLERLMTAFDQRLTVIETGLPGAATAAASSPSPVIPPSPVAPAIRGTTQPPAPALVWSDPASDPSIESGPAPVVGSVEPPAETEVEQSALTGLLERQWEWGRHAASSASQPEPALATQAASPAGVPRRSALSLDDLERMVSGRGLAWTGGLTLLLGALFFFSLAISRGWIGPEARVVIGLVAGIVVTVMGDRLVRGGDRVLGPVLVAVGIGIWNLGLIAGTRLYDFVPLWAALLGAAAGALVAMTIAIAANAQVIALYGMVTALAAPMLFAVPPERTPIAYLVIVLAGATGISIARGWAWLPPVAFVLTTTQFLFWFWAGERDTSELAQIIAISGLSLLHLIAAIGIDVWARSLGPRAIAMLVLFLNALAYTAVGVAVFFDDWTALGFFLLAGAGAHVMVGGFSVRIRGRATAVVLSTFGIGGILLTGAVPSFFDGPLVAILWAAEAVGLVWLAQRFRNVAAGGSAVAVFGLAIWHLFGIEYGTERLGAVATGGTPFVNGAGLALIALLGLLATAGAIARTASARTSFAVAGVVLLIFALPFEVAGLWLLAGWALLAVLALAVERFLARMPGAAPSDKYLAVWAAHGLTLAAGLAAAPSIYRAVAFEMPVLLPGPGSSYAGQPIVTTAIIVVAALAAIAATRSAVVRQVAGSVAILIIAHLAAFELAPALAVAVWAGLAAGAALLHRWVGGSQRIYLATALFLLAIGAVVSLINIARPSRLLLSANVEIDHPFLWSETTLAVGALAIGCFAVGLLITERSLGRWLWFGSGLLVLYLISVGIVDEFQRRAGGAVSISDLHRQSQVALSVVWAVAGGLTVAVGLVRGFAPLRWFGLGLFALVTAKVFLYDLASLDAVYRVLSFMVLGVLLLLSSYAYRRLGATSASGTDVPGAPSPGIPGQPDQAAPEGT